MQAMNLYSYREKPHNLALTTKIWLSEVTGYSLKSRKKKKKEKKRKRKRRPFASHGKINTPQQHRQNQTAKSPFPEEKKTLSLQLFSIK
jgi:hypothetical protein